MDDNEKIICILSCTIVTIGTICCLALLSQGRY